MASSKNQYVEDAAKNWWDAKMGGGKEKLATKGGDTSTASRSRNPDIEANRWSAEMVPVMKEVEEEVSPIEAECQTFQEAATGKDSSSTERMEASKCVKLEQQSVRVEAQPQIRRAVICVESGETQDYAHVPQQMERSTVTMKGD